MTAENPMRQIAVDKLVINIGTGSDDKANASAKRLLELLTESKPVAARAKRRYPAFKISKNQEIGAFVTLRGEKIATVAKRLFDAVDNRVGENAITNNSLSFGIREYIDISGIKYDPKIGMMGMNINLSFRRKGLRVALRKRRKGVVSVKHRVVTRDEIKDYLKKNFNVETA